MMKILLLLVGFITAYSGSSDNQTDRTDQTDFLSWNEEEIFAFLGEVQQHVWGIPVETNAIEQVTELYELYFSPELSKEIVSSLYIETDDGWKIPDGDAGYIFHVPNREAEDSEVIIEQFEDYIKIREVYEIGMFQEIEYTIRYIDQKPKIVEWRIVYD